MEKTALTNRNYPIDLSIRNHYLKFIYCSFLYNFTFESIANFWKKFPLYVNGHLVNEKEKMTIIWDENKSTAYDYHFAVLNEIEDFLYENGIEEVIPFFNKNITELGKGLAFEPKIFLWIIEPCISAFIKCQDIRTEFLKRLHLLNKRSHPGTIQKLIKLIFKDDCYEGLIVFSPMKTQNANYPKIDGELFFAITLQLSIVRFGLRPFDRYKMYSETQSVFERVPVEFKPTIKGDTLIINNENHGNVISFSEFLKDKNISLKNIIPLKDTKVVKITRDWYCPVRKRIILHKDCAYGAPVLLYSMIYEKSKGMKALFSDFFSDIAFGPSEAWKKIEYLHRQFLWYLTEKKVVSYNPKSEYICFNNKYITQGIPAKILKKIIIDYLENGATHFEHREFIKKDELISQPKNTGFETRLKRLANKIDKSNLPFRIVKNEKGAFIFECSCLLEYSEN